MSQAQDDGIPFGAPETERLALRRLLYGAAWLVFLVFPLLDALRSSQSVAARAGIAAAALVFVVIYLEQLFGRSRLPVQRPVPDRRGALMVGTQLAIAVVLTIADRSSWASLFIFTAAGSAIVLRGAPRTAAFVLCATLIPVCGAVAGYRLGDVIAYTTTTIGIGMLMLALTDLRARNEELSTARAELARLAVAQERERFGRDLHDLLGHSLSVIALKAELAGRLLPQQADEAAAEISEVEFVARQALGEVRQAVSGYHQPTLEGELAGARMALSAAGIEADVQRDQVALDPATEAMLAWAVREGATNVIRHSRAAACAIRIGANLSHATAEVIDDGLGPAPNPAPGPVNGGGQGNGAGASNGTEPEVSGTGLLGLAERARELGGAVDAGPANTGGFRLLVSVPVGAR